MKKPVVIIYSIIISLTLIFSIGLFGYNIYTDYNKGSTVAENRFERMALSIKQIPESVNINSHNFENLIIKAINGIDNYSTLRIDINNQTYLAYPTENDKQPGSSKLVVNKTKQFNLHGNDVVITADLYVLTPSVINQDVKISFGIILFATVLTLFMILLDTLIGDSTEKKVKKSDSEEYVINTEVEYIAPQTDTSEEKTVDKVEEKSEQIDEPIIKTEEELKLSENDESENNEIIVEDSPVLETPAATEETAVTSTTEETSDFTEETPVQEVETPVVEKRYNLISEELSHMEKIDDTFDSEEEKATTEEQDNFNIGIIDFVAPETEESNSPVDNNENIFEESIDDNNDLDSEIASKIEEEIIEETPVDVKEESEEEITHEPELSSEPAVEEERKPSAAVTSIFIPKFEAEGKSFEITSVPAEEEISQQIENTEIQEYKNQLENDETLPLPSDEIKPMTINAETNDPVGLYSPVTGFGWESYLNSRLENELNRATASEIDLSLFIIQLKDVLRSSEMTQEFCKYLSAQFQFRDMIFEYKDDSYVAIKIGSTIDDSIPFANKLLLDIDNILKGMGKCYIGISSRSIRMVGAERMISEAEQALNHAKESPDSPIVAFRVDAEKYRKYLEENS